MSIKLNNGTVLRNLEEQVQYLTNYHDVNQGIAQWGIRVVGKVDNENQLPSPETYEGEYGDAIAVGTSAPFSFYIWTRASIEGKPAYWFPFGNISIVGPEGPVGPTGGVGPAGHSPIWYSGSSAPSSSQTYVEGDMYLQENGQVYRYHNNQWESLVNIRGPQGVQGIQGIQGEKGNQGSPGIQGPKGDVGGFINIWGIVANTSQLPTPSSLKNLTVAYLVGTANPYDLYVQIGENSETAVWTNTGPFNAGTLVSVNGSYQNVWDSDTKVNKKDYSGNIEVYVVDSGNETMVASSSDTVANQIPIRTTNGHLKVPATTSPGSGMAVSTTYVTNYAVAKNKAIDSSKANKKAVYGISYNSSGNPVETLIPVSNIKENGAIVQYDSNGRIRANAPSTDAEVTTKGYVDTNVNNLKSTLKSWQTISFSSSDITVLNNTNATVSVQNFMFRYNKDLRLINLVGKVTVNATNSFNGTPTVQFNYNKVLSALGVTSSE